MTRRTILAAVLSLVVCAGGLLAGQPPAELRIVTYNIKHGRGMDDVVDLERTAGVLRPLRPDFVGLQEVDDRATRSGSVPEAERLGQLLGMQPAFGKFMDFQGGGYGLAVLSRFPIVRSSSLRLPEGNEPRVALVVEVRMPDETMMAVVNVHFDWVRDDAYRFAQAEVVAKFLDTLTMPYVLLGDFNDVPESRTLSLFRARATEAAKPAGGNLTFSSTKPEREIDFVFFAPATAFRAREVRVIDERMASDHRPVLAVLERRSPPSPEWPGFRGPGMDGLAIGARLPERWSKTANVRWAIDVPGRGWSSPIIAGDTVFVTSAISSRPFKEPTPGIYGNDFIAEMRAQGLPTAEINRRLRARDNELPEESDEIRYVVYAFDLTTGALKWEREAHKGLPIGGRHRKNTYASETPFTDGERVYVSFGLNVGLFAYSLNGDLLWKRTWPPQPIYLDFGTGTSPVVHDGRVYLLQDSEKECYLTALDAKTGADVWRVARKDKGWQRTSAWSTPFIWKNSRRTEIVTTGHGFIMSYGLDGAELWRLGKTFMPLMSPLAVGDVLYAGTGAQEGDAARPFFAIKAGATGDITLAPEATSNDWVLWSHPRAAGYTPSALVHQGRVYLVHDTGVMVVVAADTGKEIYKVRVGGVGHTFSASPIATADRIYFTDEEGVTIVIAPGDEYREIAQNDLGEMTVASPAVAGDALVIRTAKQLYRIQR